MNEEARKKIHQIGITKFNESRKIYPDNDGLKSGSEVSIAISFKKNLPFAGRLGNSQGIFEYRCPNPIQ